MREGSARAAHELGKLKKQMEQVQASSSGASSGGEVQAQQVQMMSKIQSQMDQAKLEIQCYESTKELTDFIKQKHQLLVATLEHMLTEIVAKVSEPFEI